MEIMPNLRIMLSILFVLISIGLILYFEYQLNIIKNSESLVEEEVQQAKRSLRKSIILSTIGLPLLISYLFLVFR
jgi:Na+/H+ antiporter NhaC